MEWEFSGDSPIYLQIVKCIKLQIASGKLQPGEKIASVRELALEAGVNPNTMQKALSELEREGVLYSQRTAGRFVAENESRVEMLQERMAHEQIVRFAQTMEQLGYGAEEALLLFEQYVHGKQAEEEGEMSGKR